MVFQHHHGNPYLFQNQLIFQYQKYYITFNFIIRFHKLKCTGKEIIKVTAWGPRHNNVPRLVALISQEMGKEFLMIWNLANISGSNMTLMRGMCEMVVQ